MSNKKLWKVLIVDDEKKWVDEYEEWVKDLVKKFGWDAWFHKDVKKAYNGEDALKIIRDDKEVNVVISDIFMQPKCNRECVAPANPDQEEPFGGIWLATEIYTAYLEKSDKKRDIGCLLISNKRDAEKYLKKWIPENWYSKGSEYSEGFIQFVEKFSETPKFEEEFLNKTYLAFAKVAKIWRMMEGVPFSKIITINSKMKEILSKVQTVSETPSTVLLLGESGTGKELFARAIHHSSPRKDKPFIVVNCAAMPENLLESEFLGYEKGAFTGAVAMQYGKFELANNGTIFLDEVGDMSPSLQVKLLRVLAGNGFMRVGGKETINVDVRVIAATNQDIEKMVKEKKFREDLYYRINIVPIEIPPLRERKEDIPLLVKCFLKEFNTEANRSLEIKDETIEQMFSYDWHGNVRELENFIERAVASKNEGEIIEAIKRKTTTRDGNIPDPMGINIPDEGLDMEGMLTDVKKGLIKKALQMTNGNMTEAAKLLQVNARTFARHCGDLDLKAFIQSLKKD